MTGINQPNSTVQAENSGLRQRVIDLEQALAIQSQIVAQQERALQRAQYLLTASPVVTYSRETTGDYAFIFISDNVIKIFEYRPDQFITNSCFWTSCIHPDDATQISTKLNDLFTQEQSTHEYRFLHQDGTYRWVRDQLRLIRDTAGQPVEIVGSWQDITERKQAEDESGMFKALIDNAPDGIVIANMQGEYVYANVAMQSMSGYGAELIGMKGLDVLDEDPHVVKAAFQRLNERGSVNFITTYRRSDGSTFPVDTISYVFNTAGGEPYVMAVVRDISGQRQREDELRLFQALVENAPDGISVANIQGEYVYANAAMQSMSGYGAELIGMSGFDVLEEEPHVIESAFQQLLKHGNVKVITTYRRSDGSTFPVDVTSYIINTAGGEPRLIAFARDISEQKRAEAERLALQQQVIDAQRHSLRELSTPLIPITTTTVVMPLIGAIDTARAQQILETLLEGVAAYKAETAIIDITGVQVVDTQVANALIRAAQAVRLLGARVLLTGIKPQIAQTLVHLGISLDGIQTYGSLQSGVRMALHQDMAA